MDSNYYERKAHEQDKKAADLERKRGGLEGKKAGAETDATKAEKRAAETRSDNTRRSELRRAERKHAEAAKLGKEIAKLTGQVADARTKAARYRQDASKARAREDRKARAEADRMARRQAAQDRAADRDMARLRDNVEELLRQSRAVAPSTMTVLFMAGAIELGDDGEKPLHLDREVRLVRQKVRASEHRDQVRIEDTQATQVRDVVDALNEYRPDVVHFSGHGGLAGLVFDGPDGEPRQLAMEHLATLLLAAPNPIRMVVLNACESADAAALASEFVDFAIGMQQPIDDEAAKEFAGQLYGSLGAGLSVAEAFQQAVAQAVAVLGDASLAGSPTLHVRPGLSAEGTVLVAVDDGDVGAAA